MSAPPCAWGTAALRLTPASYSQHGWGGDSSSTLAQELLPYVPTENLLLPVVKWGPVCMQLMPLQQS